MAPPIETDRHGIIEGVSDEDLRAAPLSKVHSAGLVRLEGSVFVEVQLRGERRCVV